MRGKWVNLGDQFLFFGPWRYDLPNQGTKFLEDPWKCGGSPTDQTVNKITIYTLSKRWIWHCISGQQERRKLVPLLIFDMLDVYLSATPHSYAQIVFSNEASDDEASDDERLDAICAEMVKAIQDKEIPGLGEMECVGVGKDRQLRFVDLPNAGTNTQQTQQQKLQSCKGGAALLQQAVQGRSVLDGSTLAYAAWGDLASRLPTPTHPRLGYYKKCNQYCGDTPVTNFLGFRDVEGYSRQRCNSFAKNFNIYFGLDHPMARAISCNKKGALEIAQYSRNVEDIQTGSRIDAHVDCMAVAIKMNWILSNKEFYDEFDGSRWYRASEFNCTSFDPYDPFFGSVLTLSKVVSSSSTPEISEPDFQN